MALKGKVKRISIASWCLISLFADFMTKFIAQLTRGFVCSFGIQDSKTLGSITEKEAFGLLLHKFFGQNSLRKTADMLDIFSLIFELQH